MIHSRWPAAVANPSDEDVMLLTLRSSRLSAVVTHDGFWIGSHRTCDLQIADSAIAPFYGVVHRQRGAIWIEAAHDEILLTVNDRVCRRMALRDGDQIQIGAESFVVEIGSAVTDLTSSSPDRQAHPDLESLSADELCDLIASEQSMIQEFTEGRRSGWNALLHAIEVVRHERMLPEELNPSVMQIDEPGGSPDGLLDHLNHLHQILLDRNKELSEQESKAISSASLLAEQQQQMASRLNEILSQLNKAEPLNELRASA